MTYVVTTEIHVSESYAISSLDCHLEMLLFMYIHKSITYHGQPFLSTFVFTHICTSKLFTTAVLAVVKESLMQYILSTVRMQRISQIPAVVAPLAHA